MNVDTPQNLEQLSESPQWSIDQKIDDLCQRYLDNYKLSQDTIEYLTAFQTEQQLNNLKEQVQNQQDKIHLKELSELKLKDFLWELAQLKEIKAQREVLKEQLLSAEKNIIPQNWDTFLSKTFGKNGLKKLEYVSLNPSKPHHHITGVSLWITKSLTTTALCGIQLWADICKTPYHLALWISGKAEINNFKDM